MRIKKRFFVFSDAQIPDHNERAVNIAISRIKDFKPTDFYIIGDFIDNEPLMGMHKRKHIELSTECINDLDSQWKEGNRVLNLIDSSLPGNCHKYFLKGNHEQRGDDVLDRIKEKGERIKDLLLSERALKLKDRKYRVIPYNDYIQLGKLFFTHGFCHSSNHARQHLIDTQKSVIYGHLHSIDVETLNSPMREVPLMAVCVGCLANLNPQWRRGKPNAYDHAFAEGYVNDRGSFWVYINRIVRGGLITGDGKVY